MSTLRLSLLGDCVIHVNDTAVDPSSTHLFALLLVLGLESERRVSRSELHRLLFAPDTGTQQASHNLRQLLYRVRRLGVVLDETVVGLRLPTACITSVADQLRLIVSGECENASIGSVTFLPSYSPRLPQPFLEWLDRKRDSIDTSIRSALRSATARLVESHAWHAAYRASSTLVALDPHSEDAIAVMAESLTMMGRRNEALALLTSFGGLDEPVALSVERLRPLRARISRLADVKPEGMLRGRADCLSALEAEWEKLGSDGARRAALIGNAGIGKTRVAEAFATRVRLLGGRITRYRCDTASFEQPLGLFSDILPELRSLRGSIGASPDLASALDRLRPVVAPDALLTSDISVEAVRAEVQRALIDLLEAVSEEKPLLLIIDDAHHLDPVSAHVIRSLCTRTNAARLLMLTCARRSRAHMSVLEPAHRGITYIVNPLPQEVSRQVIFDVAGAKLSESQVEWCLAQAAGNPFYLHTLASQRFVDSTLVPFDIRSLASNAYSSLGAPTRSVLESCLLLGRLATLGRVGTISGVSEADLLIAFRELETLDLLQFSGGVLVGPHALLHDALIGLIPSTVAALLHRRIAATLEQECDAEDYVFPIAWAAAQSWLAAGDPHGAARLVRKCARQAAFMGEATVATQLVSRVVDANLPVGLQAELLDELTTYAEASASPAILASASRARLKLAKALGDVGPRLREFERRIIEADVMTSNQAPGATESLLVLLQDESNTPLTRAHAAARLLVFADQDFDTSLAERVFAHLPGVSREASDVQTVCLRAEVVFNTFCGNAHVARQLSLQLLRQFSEPSIKQESIKARSFAAYALHRLRDERAASAFADTYQWMMKYGVYRVALYSASMLTTIAIGLGDFDLAADWLAKSKVALNGEAPHELSPESGLYADEAFLAMQAGRYDDAEPLLIAPEKQVNAMLTARRTAVTLAMWIRLKQLRGDAPNYAHELIQLEDLYTRGKRLGGQDLVVEALWSARVLAGATSSASHLLADYLKCRREIGQPEWSLLHTTAADEAWSAISPQLAACRQ